MTHEEAVDSHEALKKNEPRHSSIENEEKQASHSIPGPFPTSAQFKAIGVFLATSFLLLYTNRHPP